jgi:hypothetical protein
MTFAWDAERMGEAPAEARAAIEAVASGLDLALARAGADEVSHKDARDIVTADDVRIEDGIRADLGAAGRLRGRRGGAGRGGVGER